MTDKITNLLDVAKEEGGPVLPIEKEDLLNHLQSIPDDIADGYIQALESSVENLLLWKNIVSMRNSPLSCKHLLESLDDDLFDRLHKVVMGLLAKESLEEVNQIIEATFNVKLPSDDSKDKARTILKTVKSLEIDHYKKAREFAELSRDLKLLADIFTCEGLNLNSKLDEWLIDRMSTYTTEDIDMLMIYCNSMKVSKICQKPYNENIQLRGER